MFDDELAKARLETRDAQEYAAQVERQKIELAAELRQARDETGQRQAVIDGLKAELRQQQAVAADARRRAEHVAQVELELVEVRDDVRRLSARAEKAEAARATAEAKAQLAQAVAAEAEATVARRSEEFARAQEVLAAHGSLSAALQVLAGG